MSTITPESDSMCRDLEADLQHDHADLSDEDLWGLRSATADLYMLYAVKPITAADTSPRADAIRERRRELLAAVWLHLDALCLAR